MGKVPEHLRGDGPCRDCDTTKNIIWFTDNVLWNEVMAFPEVGSNDPGGIVCIPCFVRRVDRAGLCPTGWRLLPDWHWETREEQAARQIRSALRADNVLDA